MAEIVVSKASIDAFQQDGAVLLKGVFADWVNTLQAGLDRNLKQPGLTARYHKGDGEAPFFNDYCNWQRIKEYKAFIFDSTAAQIAAQLTNSTCVRFFHEHVVLKEAGSAVETPWHQDQPYYCVNGAKTCSLWIALDHVPRELAVEYIGGSQDWGKMYTPMYFSGKPVNPKRAWDALPDFSRHRSDYRILAWETQPGDAIAFNFRTVHGAPVNSSAGRRAAITFRWLGDDVTYADRGGDTSPPFPDLNLKEGDVMNAPEFPVVC